MYYWYLLHLQEKWTALRHRWTCGCSITETFAHNPFWFSPIHKNGILVNDQAYGYVDS
jgi:hypothetical protein